jgi:hypothetical protein
MLKKSFALWGLLLLSTFAQAEIVELSGSISSGTAPLITLAPPGTAFAGDLDWDVLDSELDSGQVTLGGFCFTDDASGLPPVSPTCGALTAVPLLTTGQATYDGTPAAPGSTFQQAGSTFDGLGGTIELIAYSPTFMVNIAITLSFDGFGGGSVFADAGTLGTANGPFTVDNFPVGPGPGPGPGPSGSVSVPTMSAYGLGLMSLGLVIVAFRRFRK